MLEARPPSVAPPAAGAQAAAQPGPETEPDALARDVARAVRELRIGLGLSERGAARLLGTSQTQLRRMEDPRYLPSLRSLSRLATAYGQRLHISFESRERAAKAKSAATPAAKTVRPERRSGQTRRQRPRGGRRRGRSS